MRRLGSLLVLLALVVGPPALLLQIGFYAWGNLNLWAPADFRVLLGMLTVAGWLAWSVFVLSVVLEAVRIVTSGRIAIHLPGLSAPQAFAGVLLAAVLATAAGPTLTAVASGPAVQAPVTAALGDLEQSLRADAPAAAPQVAAPDTVDDPAVVHVVAEGDDLWSLAERYYGQGTDWRKIVRANPDVLADPTSELAPGTALLIVRPLTDAEGASAPRTPLVKVTHSEHRRPEHYTVKKGDTLWQLAEERLGDGNRYPELQRLNADLIRDPDYIQAGWRILLPVVESAPAQSPDGGSAEMVPPVAPQAPDAPVAPAQPAAPAVTATPAALAPTASATPATPADTDTAAAAPAWDVVGVRVAVGGLAALAASGVVAALLARRREREASRELGRTFPDVDPQLQRIEAAFGLASVTPVVPADAEALAPSVPTARVALIARGMRLLADAWWRSGTRPPRLRRAILDPDDWILQFESAPPVVPPPFTVAPGAAMELRVPWAALDAAADPAAGVAYPGLVTLGEDVRGRLVMVDAVTWGVLAIDADAPDLPAMSVSALTLELGCSPWADELTLSVVTRDPGFVTAAATGRVRVLADAGEAIADLERQARERHALVTLADNTYESLRLDPDRADAWAPAVYVFEDPLDAAALARVRAAVDGERLGLAAVVPTTGDQVAAEQDRPRLVLSRLTPTGAPQGLFLPAGYAFSAQTLGTEARESIGHLLDGLRTQQTLPATWWDHDQPSETPATPGPAVMAPDIERAAIDAPTLGSDWAATVLELRPREAAPTPEEPGEGATEVLPPDPAGPLLRLFGNVGLDGAAGEAPAKAKRRCLEYLGWLLEHPGATASEMNNALFIVDSTRRSNVSRLRAWLGAAPDGTPYLPEAYSGLLALHADVTSDWATVNRLLEAGVNRATTPRLRAALDLVDGAPMADAAPGEWAWANGLRQQMAEVVRDAAVVLARRERASGDLDAARAACRRGLLVAPDDELIACERMRIEASDGDPEAARAVLRGLQRTAERAGVDLRPETVALAQELFEGRPRPVLPTGSEG